VSAGLSRRALLLAAAAGLGGGAWLLLSPRTNAPSAGRDALLAPFSDPGAVGELGSSVLAAVPRWRDASRLRAELEPELRWDEAGFEDRLVARVREDFAAGRVESVDGWLLSETEAKLYALAELLPGGKR